MATPLPQTLGALRASEFTPARLARSVKDELRENLIANSASPPSQGPTRAPLFPGIVGYEDTVVPQTRQRRPLASTTSSSSASAARRSRASSAPSPRCSIRMPLRCRLRGPRQPLRAHLKVQPRPHRQDGRRDPDCVAHPRRPLRRKTRHPRRYGSRSRRRHRPHQGSAHQPGPRLRVDHALRSSAARQPRNLRHQRDSRPRRQNPGRALQHHAGGRRAD